MKKKGWISDILSNCIKLKSGDNLTAKKMVPGDFPVYGGNGIAGHHKDYNLEGEQIIIGRVGALCGNSRYVDEKIWLTDNAFRVSEYKYDFDLVFLNYLLNHIDLRSHARQAAQPVISNSSLKDVILSFPESLPEQKQIVTILDEAFAAIDQAKANLEKNIQNAKELFQSKLNEIFSQKGEGWEERSLKEVVNSISTGPFGSLLHKSDYVSEGIPLVNPINMINKRIVPDEKKQVDPETLERLSNYRLRKGDIVVARRGEIGRCAIVEEEQDGWLCGTGSFFIRPAENVLSRYILEMLSSQKYRETLEAESTGATMKNISNKALSNLVVTYPSVKEQKAIIEKINELDSYSIALEEKLQKKLDSLEELKKSILQKAFAGGLTQNAVVL